MNTFLKDYKKKLITQITNLDENILTDCITLLESTLSKNSKIYVIGNGGSASTASHMVNDIGAGLARRDIKYFNIESLSDNTAVCTALANDIGYEHIFSMQLKNKITADDLLIAISCSGNSENIINAVNYSKSQGAKILGLTGFDGGKLKSISDVNYHIPTDENEYGIVEDLHMIFDHIIYSYYLSKQKDSIMK